MAVRHDDLTGKVTPTTPGMTVHGPHTLTFPPKYEWDRYCHDGHGGPPYRMFGVGTTPAAAPGGSCQVKMRARACAGAGRVKVTLSCSDWGTKSGFENVFKMFPFSTKYGGLNVQTTDGAGEQHVSQNKNQWLTSDLTTLKRLRITYPV